MRHIKFFLLVFISVIFLTGCSISLAEDITPPPSVAQPSPITNQTSTPVSVVLPMMEPDIQNGETLYAEKCAPCHGVTGMGDGAQSDQLPNAVPALGNLSIARDAKPIDWYSMVTVGNIENFMPGFQSLSDRERWDVTAYALSLSLSEDMIVRGEEIFSENCVECHTSENLPLQNASAMAERSLSDIQSVILSGIDTEMHSFQDVLSADDSLAVASYVRYLGFTPNQNPTSDVTVEENTDNSTTNEQSTSEFTEFSITGQLENLDIIPENLMVVLSAYDGMDMVYQLEAPVSETGSYEFDNLENVSGRIYQASVVIDDIQHISDVLHEPVIDSNGIAQLPISISKTSFDSSVLYAERMHVFFDFLDESTIQIVEMFVIQNPSDSVIIARDSFTPVISFNLPAEAQNLQFDSGVLGEDYIQTDNGFGSMFSINANSSTQILFAYELPYSKSLDLAIQLPMPVNASIFMLPADTVNFESSQLTFTGQRDVQGMQIQTYAGDVMDANSTINVNLNGKVKQNVSLIQSGNTTSIIIGTAAFLLALVFAVVYFRGKVKTNRNEDNLDDHEDDLDSLLDAVIALDDAFQSGEIPEEAYLNRRNELTRLIKQQQDSEE